MTDAERIARLELARDNLSRSCLRYLGRIRRREARIRELEAALAVYRRTFPSFNPGLPR